MPSYITLELVDGVRVVVPDSLEQITAYILQANGAKPGTQALTRGTAAAVNSVVE